jgi:hypothetical protein
MNTFPKPAAPAEVSPDPIEALRREFTEREDRRDKVIAELCALVFVQGARIDVLEASNAALCATRQVGVDEERASNRPPGNWTELKVAAFKAKKSPAWIYEYRQRDMIREYREAGRVYVDMDAVLKCAANVRSCRRK